MASDSLLFMLVASPIAADFILFFVDVVACQTMVYKTYIFMLLLGPGVAGCLDPLGELPDAVMRNTVINALGRSRQVTKAA